MAGSCCYFDILCVQNDVSQKVWYLIYDIAKKILDLLRQVITDVVLALLSYVAEGDWEERHELQRQGIETAKEAGKYLGRPRVEYPENWSEYYGAWKEGSITAVEAMRRTGLKKDSFYRLVKKYEDGE